MSWCKFEEPSREDMTEGRPTALKGAVPDINTWQHHQRKEPRTLAQTFATLSYLKEPIRLPLKPIQGATSSWET